MEVSEYLALLFEYFDPNFNQCSEDDLALFVVTGWQWIIRVNVNSYLANHENIWKALTMIRDALQTALVRDIQPYIFLNELRPFYRIMMDVEPGTSWFSPTYISTFASFLHVIETYSNRNIYNFWLGSEDLHSLLEKVHANGDCNQRNCPWTSHSCDNPAKCPLLKPPRTKSETRPSTPVALDPLNPSLPNNEPAHSEEVQPTFPRPLLDRGKSLFLKRIVRLPQCADEESGNISAKVAIEAAAGPSPRLSTGLAAKTEGIANTEDIPLVIFVESLPTDAQISAGVAETEAGDEGGSKSSAYVTGGDITTVTVDGAQGADSDLLSRR